jgi:hypothetical protein
MDMDQLIGEITKQTGVSPDLAQNGVQMVGGFLKGKLPAGAGGQIDNALGGQTISTPQLTQATTFDQITGAISQHTGIPDSAAKSVVQMSGSFLADKIPAPFGDQVKGLLGTDGAHGSIIDQAKDMLGGLFGHHDH